MHQLETPADIPRAASEWVEGVKGNFPIHKAVVRALPQGTRIVSAESYGVSLWTKIAKVSAVEPEGANRHYFLKCSRWESARAIAEGEYESALVMNKAISGFVPKPIAWGRYEDDGVEVFFFISDFLDMDFSTAPDPAKFMAQIAKIHKNCTSPNGMFGFHVPTVYGRLERNVRWEKSWAASFTHQLKAVIKYDKEANSPWPEFNIACDQLIDKVIPRLLGILQSGGRNIKPSLIHGDLWERNVGIDKETGEPILFDPGCTYAHNEMEFGTWRCSWTLYFRSSEYMHIYKEHIAPSPPENEWDDRNRLYSIPCYIAASAAHPGRVCRQLAYNDMLYLCEKYAPLDILEPYDPKLDISVTGSYIPFVVEQLQ